MSIQVRGNGKLLVRYTDQLGRSKAQTFEAHEKRKAETFDAEMKRRRRMGEIVSPSDMSLRELREQWLRLGDGRDLAPKTREVYDGAWKKHVDPRLGKAPISQVRTIHINEFRISLEDKGVGQATVTKCLTMLSGMFRFAKANDWIRDNPVSDASKPKPKPSRIVVPLSPTQVETIREQLVAKGRCLDALLVSVLAYAGLRPGEALALRWSDLIGEQLHVTKAVSVGEEKETKTKRNRVVKLLPALKSDLLEHRMRIGRPLDSTLIFPAHDGSHWTEQDWRNWRQRVFAPAVDAIGLPKATRPYDLRHTMASLRIAAGQNPVFIAKQMGHSPSMLLDRYSHILDQYEEQHIDLDAEIEAARGRLSSTVQAV